MKKRSPSIIPADYSSSFNRFIFDAVGENKTVLDVGCWDGGLGRALATKKKCTVDGIDFEKKVLEKAQKNDWFDLGGKAPLRKIIEDKLHSKKIIPIFLFANESTIVEHLQYDSNWKKRSNYRYAEETGLDWMKLAEAHRSERSSVYKDVGVIILSIDNKKPAEIAHEILYRVKELELVCRNRYNAFTRFNGTFFSCNSTKESNSKKTDYQYNLENDLIMQSII
jgi:SAM-dependent methyltransferase